jgi:hypothetical protein
MVYPIVKFPDPILQRPAEPVTVFDEDLKKLVDDMFESMYIAHGIGLAAPQIGIPKRLTVIDLSFQKTPEDKIALINPEVVTKEGKIFEEEGCLSLPDIREKVARAAKGQNTRPGCRRVIGSSGRLTSYWRAPSSTKSTIWTGSSSSSASVRSSAILCCARYASCSEPGNGK